ncbi:uncharacterized protein LOC134822014 [Bolinopsis microptera]|uniref:uncharacterized protein LOC134822014 n=1 Tax=Bolinopsis microptera TaxID=2820187 RepID=UPI0030797C08
MIQALWRMLFYYTTLLGLTLAICELPEDRCQMDKIKFSGTQIVKLAARDFNACAMYCMWSEDKCNGISFESFEEEGSCILFSEVNDTDCEVNQLNWKSSYKWQCYSSQPGVLYKWEMFPDKLPDNLKLAVNGSYGMTKGSDVILNCAIPRLNDLFINTDITYRWYKRTLLDETKIEVTSSDQKLRLNSDHSDDGFYSCEIVVFSIITIRSPERYLYAVCSSEVKGRIKGVTCSSGATESLNITFPPSAENFIEKTFMLNLNPDLNQLKSSVEPLFKEGEILREKEKYMFASHSVPSNARIGDTHLDFLAVKGENCSKYKLLNCNFENVALGEKDTSCDGIKAHCKLKSLSKTTYWINDTRSDCKLKKISNLTLDSINVLEGELVVVNWTLKQHTRCLVYSQLLLQQFKDNQSYFEHDDRLHGVMIILTQMSSSTNVSIELRKKAKDLRLAFMKNVQSDCKLKKISDLTLDSMNVLEGELVNLTLKQHTRCLVYLQLLLQEMLQEFKDNQSYFEHGDRLSLNGVMIILTQMSSSTNVSIELRKRAKDLRLAFMKNVQSDCKLKKISDLTLDSMNVLEGELVNLTLKQHTRCLVYLQLLLQEMLQEFKDNQSYFEHGDRLSLNGVMIILTQMSSSTNVSIELRKRAKDLRLAFMKNVQSDENDLTTTHGEKVTVVLWEVKFPLEKEETLDFPMAEGVKETEIKITLPRSLNNITALAGSQSFIVSLYHDPETDFNSNLEDKRYISKLVDVEPPNELPSYLKKDQEISIGIRLTNKNKFSLYYNPLCYWYNETTLSWTTDGSVTTTFTDDSTLECNTTHLTALSIQLGKGLDAPHDRILSYLTYVCGGMSCLALVLTLIALTWFKDIRRSPSNKIHICLATTMLLAMLLFLGGAKHYDGMNEHLCKAIAIVLHYLWLTVLMWTVVESCNLWLLFIRILQARSSRFIMKSAISVFVIPGLIVGLTVGISYDSYTDETVCLLRNSNESTIPMQYYVFYAPIGVSSIVNWGIFIYVMAKICKKGRYQHSESEIQKIISKLKAVCTLSCVLGLAWVLGFLVFDHPANIAFHYLFTVCNTLQGVLIFIFHCAIKPDIYQKWSYFFRNIGKKSKNKPSSSSHFPLGDQSGHDLTPPGDPVPSNLEFLEAQ